MSQSLLYQSETLEDGSVIIVRILEQLQHNSDKTTSLEDVAMEDTLTMRPKPIRLTSFFLLEELRSRPTSCKLRCQRTSILSRGFFRQENSLYRLLGLPFF